MKYLRTIKRPETGYEIPVSVIENRQQFLNVTENGKIEPIILSRAEITIEPVYKHE